MVKRRQEALTPREKKRMSTYIWLLVGVIAIGTLFRFLLIKTVRPLISKTDEEYIDFYELNRDNIIDGTLVELNVDGILNNYAYNTQSSRFTKEYYVVWLDKGDVISISVNDDKTKKQLAELYDYTWDYIENGGGGEWDPPFSVSIRGKISKLSGIVSDAYYKHLDNMGYDESNGVILLYNIDGAKESRFNMYFATIFFGLVEIVLIATFFIIYRKNRIADAKERKEALKATIYDYEAEYNDNYLLDNFGNESYDSSIVRDTIKYLNRK